MEHTAQQPHSPIHPSPISTISAPPTDPCPRSCVTRPIPPHVGVHSIWPPAIQRLGHWRYVTTYVRPARTDGASAIVGRVAGSRDDGLAGVGCLPVYAGIRTCACVPRVRMRARSCACVSEGICGRLRGRALINAAPETICALLPACCPHDEHAFLRRLGPVRLQPPANSLSWPRGSLGPGYHTWYACSAPACPTARQCGSPCLPPERPKVCAQFLAGGIGSRNRSNRRQNSPPGDGCTRTKVGILTWQG